MTFKMRVLKRIHDLLVKLLHIERRLEPWFRPQWNTLFREPSARFIQYLINRQRKNEGLQVAEETIAQDEKESLDAIIDQMADQMRGFFKPSGYERGGNTKTHGILRATVTIRDDLPEHCRQGIFATPTCYRAYVRFAGPGPNVPADIDDVGFMSMAVKLMGVAGEKLMAEEKYTQDFITVTTPSFVTPDTRENAKLQYWSLINMPLYYFINPKDTHLLDFFMQSLWNETQYNPLGQRYWSCVPYLLGEDQAMTYSFVPKTEVDKDIPGLPFGSVPFNYLRDNMIKTLSKKDVEFDLMIQLQTDPHLMPVENNAVRWPEKLSPFIPAATVHIPKQKFDSDAQFAFAKRLKMNPWHCLPEHRPLGNQSRARRRMYYELSKFRQEMNQTTHLEPTGDEVFDQEGKTMMNELAEINKLSVAAVPDTIREAQRLLKQNRRQGLNALNDIFRAGTVPDPPLDGPYKGDVVAIDITPGLTQLVELITSAWMPWQGKRLDPAKSAGANIFSRGSLTLARIIWPFYREIVDEGGDTYLAFRFRTYVAPGRTDTDRNVLKIDYDRPSNPGLTIRPILDELVQVTDGYYLGKVHYKGWWDNWHMIAYFSLRQTG